MGQQNPDISLSEFNEDVEQASGLDAGEPVSGVDGPGDPRTSPDDPQSVEGPGGESGMGAPPQAKRAVEQDQQRSEELSTSEEPSGRRAATRAVEQDQQRSQSRGSGQESTGDSGMISGGDGNVFSGSPELSGEAVDVESPATAEEQSDAFSGNDARTTVEKIRRSNAGPLARGSAASEAARDAADFLVDSAFQDSEAAARAIGLKGERARTDEIAISGPDVFLRDGPEGTLDTEVTDSLTRGKGLVDDQSAAKLRKRARSRQEEFSLDDELEKVTRDLTGNDSVAELAGGIGTITGGLAGAPENVALAADTGTEIVANLPRTVEEQGAADVAGAAVETGGRATQAVVEAGRKNPERLAGQIIGGVATGAAAGKAAGIAGRGASDRIRTVGSTEVDIRDTTPQETIDFYRGEGGEKFPGFQDTDLLKRDQKAAVETDAEQFTPDEIQQRFDEQGATGTDLYKAIGGEPEGRGRGRSAQGFSSPELESDLADSYETVGTSFGPAISPNFLRLKGGASKFSFRPGLPDFGNKPTTVAARMDVKRSGARDVDELNEVLKDSEGDASAFTLSPDETSPGEAEVLVPPGAKFKDIGGSRTRKALRSAGIGSDFSVRVPARSEFSIPGTSKTVKSPFGANVDLPGGRSVTVPGGTRKVPIRLVVPEKKTASVDVADDFDADNVVFSGQTTSRLVRDAETSVDRPLPVPVASGTASSSAPSGGGSPATSVPDPLPSSRSGLAPADFGIPSAGGQRSRDGDESPPGISLPGSSGPASKPPTSPPPGSGGSPSGGPTSPPGSGSPSSGGGGSGPVDSPPTAGSSAALFGLPPSSSKKKDIQLRMDADDSLSGFEATVSEQQFVREIGTVEDVIGI